MDTRIRMITGPVERWSVFVIATALTALMFAVINAGFIANSLPA